MISMFYMYIWENNTHNIAKGMMKMLILTSPLDGGIISDEHWFKMFHKHNLNKWEAACMYVLSNCEVLLCSIKLTNT